MIKDTSQNLLKGTNQDDIITGGDESEKIIPGSGDDIIDGAGGDDYVIYNGNFKDYFINKKILQINSSNTTIISRRNYCVC